MKKRASKNVKLALDKKASNCLKKMGQEVINCRFPVKMNLSQLASWIVVNFFESSFAWEKEDIRLKFLATTESMRSGQKVLPAVWEEDEMDLAEVPECEGCGEYLYNGPICPNCRGMI